MIAWLNLHAFALDIASSADDIHVLGVSRRIIVAVLHLENRVRRFGQGLVSLNKFSVATSTVSTVLRLRLCLIPLLILLLLQLNKLREVFEMVLVGAGALETRVLATDCDFVGKTAMLVDHAGGERIVVFELDLELLVGLLVEEFLDGASVFEPSVEQNLAIVVATFLLKEM